eukprot:1748736-Pyramimonas_sp.AAC.1
MFLNRRECRADIPDRTPSQPTGPHECSDAGSYASIANHYRCKTRSLPSKNHMVLLHDALVGRRQPVPVSRSKR